MAAELSWTAEVTEMTGRQPGAAASGAQAPALQRADGTPIRVLVVDDEPSLAELLASVLRYEGWEIQTASDGDDYVTKPFSLEEVLARLRGLLRRAGITRARGETELVVGDLTMDEEAREVRRGGELIELTATEFELLRFLMRNPRRVLSKAQILDRVWNYDFGGQAHVVELYISYLRKKIDSGRVPLIHTVRGVGYVLKPAS